MPEHEPAPYSVQVAFRTTQSFLVAYSVHLSRGGLFLATERDVPIGARADVAFQVPGVDPVDLPGVLAWRRGEGEADGPPGIGIEFPELPPELGTLVDRLVGAFEGVQVLVLSGDRQDRTTLSRSIKSIIATAEIMQAADASVAAALMTNEVDLAVIDIDVDADGGLAMLRAASEVEPRIPTVALSANAELRERARQAGATAVATNPPPFAELQVVLVRALASPVAVAITGAAS
jgi:type IV pilus assembly protein PilZ